MLHSCKEHKYSANEIGSQREGKRGETVLTPSFFCWRLDGFISSFLFSRSGSRAYSYGARGRRRRRKIGPGRSSRSHSFFSRIKRGVLDRRRLRPISPPPPPVQIGSFVCSIELPSPSFPSFTPDILFVSSLPLFSFSLPFSFRHPSYCSSIPIEKARFVSIALERRRTDDICLVFLGGSCLPKKKAGKILFFFSLSYFSTVFSVPFSRLSFLLFFSFFAV